MKYFLVERVTFRRLRVKSGNLTAFSATGTVAMASWQTPSPEKIQMYEGQIGKVYECYLDGTPPYVRGDQVVKDGKIYDVRDVKVVDFGSQHFTKLIVVEGDVE